MGLTHLCRVGKNMKDTLSNIHSYTAEEDLTHSLYHSLWNKKKGSNLH